MTNFKVVNVVTNAVEVLDSKKSVAEFIAAANVTDNSVKTIEKKIAKAIKSDEVVYDTFKIEEIEGDVEMKTVANEIQNEVIENEEIVYDAPADLDLPQTEDVVAEENVEETPTAETEVVENEQAEKTPEELEQEYLESDDAAIEVEKENEEFAQRIENDLKDKEGGDKPAENSEEKENKRRVGKVLIAYENGQEIGRFPSIKKCAEHFKDLMGLKHMPFTPIMKSARQDVDWNQYSFKFENDKDLHIPESLKKKITESQQKADEVASSNPDVKDEEGKTEETPVAETQDEIVEVPQDEIIEELA